MSEKRIVVPEGMLQAVRDANEIQWHKVLEAALRWLDGELVAQSEKYNQPFGSSSEAAVDRYSAIRQGRILAIDDIRRMFLASEPEVPEEIMDLLAQKPHTILSDASVAGFNDAVVESYRRGQKAGTK